MNHVHSEPVPPVAPLLVDARTAAAILRISERMLWQLKERGEIPCKRIGRCVRYRVCDLMAFVEGGSNE